MKFGVLKGGNILTFASNKITKKILFEAGAVGKILNGEGKITCCQANVSVVISGSSYPHV